MSKRRRRTSKVAKFGRVVGALAGVVVVAYLVVTSGWFVRSVVLPRVAKATGMEVSVADISVGLFTAVRAKGVRVAPSGGDAVLELGALELRHGVLPLLAGKVRVDRLVLDAPVVTVVSRKGGASNLDQWLAGMPKSGSGGGSGKALALAIRNVEVKGGVLRWDREDAMGQRTKVGVAGLDVSLDKWEPPQPGRLKVAAGLEFERSMPGAAAGTGRASGRLQGEATVGMGRDMIESLGCLVRLDVPDATGAMDRFKGVGVVVDIGLGPQALTNAVVRFTQKGIPFGEMNARGRVNLPQSEVRLTYEVKGVDSRVLGWVGAVSGLDLGDAAFSASGRVDWLNGGTVLASDGRMGVTGLSMGTPRGRSAPVDVSVQHRWSVNDQTRSLVVEQLDVSMVRGGKAVVSGALDNGLNISWNKSAAGFRESTYTLKVAGADLKDWGALVPVEGLAGVVDMTLKATVNDAGRDCAWSVVTDAKGLEVGAGGRRYRGLGLRSMMQGRFRDFEQINLDLMDTSLTNEGMELAAISGVGDWRLSGANGGVQIDVEAPIPPLLALHPVEGVRLTRGALKAVVSGGIRATGPVADLAIQLNDLVGEAGGFKLEEYAASLSTGLARAGKVFEMRTFSLTGQTGTAPGGSFEALGRFDPEKRSGFLDVKLIGGNRSMLHPFLQPGLAPNRLVKVRLDANAKLQVNLDGESSVTGRVKMADLVVSHPQGRLPEVPLGMGLEFDVAQAGSTTDVRRLMLSLDPTERASNQVQVVGKLHLGTNAVPGSRFTVKSTALDFTPLYELLGSATNAVKPAPASTGEPPAVHLPVRDLLAEVDIPRVFLREIDVGNVAGKVVVKDDVVTLENLALLMNGAAMKATGRVDLGRPGYEYALSLAAEPLPLKPVFNTFLPAMKGLAQGVFLASADVRGAGVTGASLRRSLAGHVEVRATNAEVLLPDRPIEIPALFSKYIPILPPRLDPALVLVAVGKSNVMAEPFRVLEARVDMGQGVIRLTQARALSAVMGVQVGGEIRIADELDQSALDLPVSLAFGSKGALPALRTIGKATGTLAKTSFKPDVLGMGAVLGSMTLPGVGNVGARAGEALKAAGADVGQALGKAGAAVEAVVGKDGKGGASPFGGLIQGVLGGGPKPAATNAPAKPGTPAGAPGTKGKQ